MFNSKKRISCFMLNFLSLFPLIYYMTLLEASLLEYDVFILFSLTRLTSLLSAT